MSDEKRKLTEDEMQALRDSVVEHVEAYFENYDWDGAFAKFQDKKAQD